MYKIFYVVVCAWLFIGQPVTAASLAEPAAPVKDITKKERVLTAKPDRKTSFREARKMLRTLRKEWKKYDEDDDRTVLLAVLCIFLPFVAVYLKEGEITDRFWISLLLSLLFWVPGVVYSFLVVFDMI
jgi:uncharacterized membrane protein YqaE (UPF0057 family)